MSEIPHIAGDPYGYAAFIRQAHQNNWQQYLASLRGGARRGWDLCVLTASDERQAAMYRAQLEGRREAGLLPRDMRFLVMADPPGPRIGSGGATLRVLSALSRDPLGRVLIIHSGGDSRRLPHCSAIGKLFARLPRALPDGRASTVFDEFLISLSGLAHELPDGVLVASGDVLLVFDHLQLALQRPGVTGVAAAAPAEMGTHHGIYVTDDNGHSLRAYLHKPSLKELARQKAIAPDGTVQIDTGLVWLDGATVGQLIALGEMEAVRAATLNLYGDLLLPLSASTVRDDYLADTSDGLATSAVQAARAIIWERLRGIPFNVERVSPAVFIHFGTSYEYWEMVAADPALAELVGWERQVAAMPPRDAATSSLVLVNAVIEGSVRPGTLPALVVDSHLSGPFSWQGAALVANVCAEQPLALAQDVVVHQLPMPGGFVTRIFGLYDDPKRAWDVDGTFMNRSWAEWLAAAQVEPEALWPGLSPAEWILWHARLFPLAATREESLRLALQLQQPELAPPGWREAWLAAPRQSLASGFALAEGEAILREIGELEDDVAARRFLQAVHDEGSADVIKAILGSTPAAIARRGERVAAALSQMDAILRLRGFKALAVAANRVEREDAAFRTLAEMIAATAHVPSPRSSPTGGAPATSVRVEAAARIDLGGGWTDTPPYSIERGGTVLNAALTLRGEYPIAVEAIRLAEPRLILESRDIAASLEPRLAGELMAYANPADPFALLKAALVMHGIVPATAPPDMPVAELLRAQGNGLRLTTRTSIPRGSGLGTSSIMAGAVLACLTALEGKELPTAELFDQVLCLEQMLTTGGGWQDQVGGLTGGIKLVETAPGLPQQLRVTPLRLRPETTQALAERLVVVYTGQQRLAKNLLRAVMGRWMARDPEMVWILQEIARLALAMRAALESGDLDQLGWLLAEHWALNRRMDPGCTNPFIDGLFARMAPYICGGKLAGAGGGGFAFVVARDAARAAQLAQALRQYYPGTPVGVWTSAIPATGMRIRRHS